MHEIVINMHMHTPYSDGMGSHEDIARAAITAGLDAVITTDHNIWVQEVEGYYEEKDGSVLLLVGEEIHDQTQDPQKNHLLVLGTNCELSQYAPNPQILIDKVNESGGLSFIAHPIEFEAEKFGEGDLSWVNWEVNNFTGIELWNAMTEFKSLLKGYLEAIFYSFNFSRVAQGPFAETLKKWDELLSRGKPIVAVGGSDAHAFRKSLGPISQILFPYEKHFKAINTHLLLPEPLSGNTQSDKQLIMDALRNGHGFVAYDLPTPTRGFMFTVHLSDRNLIMGDTIAAHNSATLQIKLPRSAECLLLKDGEVIRSTKKRGTIVHKIEGPGVYRVEAYIPYKGKRRGWIFSNPIYVR